MNKSLLITTLLSCFSFESISHGGFIGEGGIDNLEKSVPLTNKRLSQLNNSPFVSINKDDTPFIDIRAYGDSGWSWTHESPAMAANFGNALDDFSPSGEIYRGDINFINWETTVGYTCDEWHAPYVRGRSYAFLARPENVTQAINRGIDNFALSNNHTRDCVLNSDTGLNGQLTTIDYMDSIKKEYPNLIHHGISRENKNQVSILERMEKGTIIKIAFASYYTGRESCPHSVCTEDAEAIIDSFKHTSADLKILMIHTMSNQDKLVQVGTKFIKEAGGDIVFGSGPHRWKPIRYVENQKGRGIIFDSLGNFLHPSMAAQSKNIIARILLNPHSKKIEQVQAISVRNESNRVIASEVSPIVINSELVFSPQDIESDGKKFKAMYFNF